MTVGLIAGCGNKMPTPKIAEDTKEDDADKKESKEDTSKAASSSDSEGVNWLLACYTSGDNVIKYNDFAKFGVEDIAALRLNDDGTGVFTMTGNDMDIT